MPHVKVTEKGFENLTGMLGNVEFVDGVSVENLPQRDADRLGSIMRVENSDSGEQVNAAKTIEETLRPERKQSDPVEETTDVSPADEDSVESVENDALDESVSEETEEVTLYTEAALQIVADEEGIEGLRQIANPLGVKGTSIVKLIDAILKAQG